MKFNLFIAFIFVSANVLFAQTDTTFLKNELDKSHERIQQLNEQIKNVENDLQQVKETNQSLKDSLQQLRLVLIKQSSVLESINDKTVNNKNNLDRYINSSDIFRADQNTRLENLKKTVLSNSENLKKSNSELNDRIDNSDESTNQNFQAIKQKITNNTLYWIIAFLLAVLFTGIVYLFLRKQASKQKMELENDLTKTKRKLEEESLKLDNQLAEVIAKQIKIIEEERKVAVEEQTFDHSLVLKMADRLVSMEKNISRMDSETKGLKQLQKNVKNIKDNFAANGYEIVEMVGKPYHEGMKVNANFILDEELESGEQIITRIIKPQVNYKGVMIQAAQIEVSQGE